MAIFKMTEAIKCSVEREALRMMPTSWVTALVSDVEDAVLDTLFRAIVPVESTLSRFDEGEIVLFRQDYGESWNPGMGFYDGERFRKKHLDASFSISVGTPIHRGEWLESRLYRWVYDNFQVVLWWASSGAVTPELEAAISQLREKVCE